jgi:hypothetical protein
MLKAYPRITDPLFTIAHRRGSGHCGSISGNQWSTTTPMGVELSISVPRKYEGLVNSLLFPFSPDGKQFRRQHCK